MNGLTTDARLVTKFADDLARELAEHPNEYGELEKITGYLQRAEYAFSALIRDLRSVKRPSFAMQRHHAAAVGLYLAQIVWTLCVQEEERLRHQ